MHRYVTIAGPPDLEGVWHGDTGPVAVVAPPHPLMGGELGNPVVRAIVAGAASSGLRPLAFNFRGVGDSDGDKSGDPEDAVQDYRAALGEARGAGAIQVLAGYSFGAVAAMRVALQADARVVVVAPPPSMLSEDLAKALGARLTVIAGTRDSIADAEALSALVGSSGGTVHAISADHFFSAALRDVERLVAGACR